MECERKEVRMHVDLNKTTWKKSDILYFLKEGKVDGVTKMLKEYFKQLLPFVDTKYLKEK